MSANNGLPEDAPALDDGDARLLWMIERRRAFAASNAKPKQPAFRNDFPLESPDSDWKSSSADPVDPEGDAD